MAVIWLVLRNEHDVRIRYMRKVLNARGVGMAREEKFGMPHSGGTRYPWVDEDGESAWRLPMLYAGR